MKVLTHMLSSNILCNYPLKFTINEKQKQCVIKKSEGNHQQYEKCEICSTCIRFMDWVEDDRKFCHLYVFCSYFSLFQTLLLTYVHIIEKLFHQEEDVCHCFELMRWLVLNPSDTISDFQETNSWHNFISSICDASKPTIIIIKNIYTFVKWNV